MAMAVLRKLTLAAGLAAVLPLGLAPGAATAHGGGGIETDICRIRVGSYLMHFAGYQPDVKGGEEFCGSFPLVGESILVFDLVDRELRRVPIGMTLIEESTNPPVALASIAPTMFATGTFKTVVDFQKPGNYVAVLTMGEQEAARFPIAVGVTSYAGLLKFSFIIAAIVGGGLLLYFSKNLSLIRFGKPGN
jgi:hypothetical protein